MPSSMRRFGQKGGPLGRHAGIWEARYGTANSVSLVPVGTHLRRLTDLGPAVKARAALPNGTPRAEQSLLCRALSRKSGPQPTTRAGQARVPQIDTLIIGAGQAGLSA